MPIYEYWCPGCAWEMEKFRSRIIASEEDKGFKCPECRLHKMKRCASKSSFQLKGGGWAKDGYSNAPSGNKDT